MAGDRLDHSGLHRLAQAIAVGAGAQRRLYVVQAGEVAQRFVGENQLVQRHIGGDRQAQFLGLGDQARATGAGQLAEVRAYASLLDQQQVARQCHGFGGFRDARQTKEAGHCAFVGEAALGQVAVLGVEDHRQVEGCRVLQGACQGAVVAKGFQAVAECHAASVAQGNQLCQLFAFQAFAQGADREHFAVPGFAGAVEDQLGHCRGVQHRLGLRRAAQAGDAASGRSAGFAGDAAFAAVTRLAQGNVEVDQAGGGDQACCIDAACRAEASRRCAHGDNLAGINVQVSGLVQAALWINDPGAENTEGHWAFSCSN
ncbi:hypothetical protein D3C81_1249280 [compost metagenome]